MSTNDGRNLVVLGLSFRQHHNLHMQQILRTYNRLPENIGDRGALFAALFDLSRSLDTDEIANLETWLRDGGVFPQPTTAVVTGPVAAVDTWDNDGWDVDEGEDNDEQSDDEIGYYDHRFTGRGRTIGDQAMEEDPVTSSGRALVEGPGHTSQELVFTAENQLDEDHDIEEDVPMTSDSEHEIADEQIEVIASGEDVDEAGAMEHDDEDDSSTASTSTPARILRHSLGSVGPTRRRASTPEGMDPDLIVDEFDVFQYPPESFDEGGDFGGEHPDAVRDDVECTICAELQPRTELIKYVTPRCTHELGEHVCLPCLRETIRFAVEDGQLNIHCPLCHKKMHSAEIKQHATPEVWARFEYLTLRADPDVVFCLGLDCGHGQKHKDPNPTMICDKCSTKTCAVHKLPWHEGLTCEEFDMTDAQIERWEQAEATAKLLAKDHSQICPNCHQGVTRQDGCDHMICRCGNEWCYQCGVSFERLKQLGAAGHGPSCILNPNRVAPRRDAETTAAGTLTEMLHGVPVSDTLQKARGARNERTRAEMRPKLAEAAEKRIKEMEKKRKEAEEEREKENGGVVEKKRKFHLNAPWEEK